MLVLGHPRKVHEIDAGLAGDLGEPERAGRLAKGDLGPRGIKSGGAVLAMIVELAGTNGVGDPGARSRSHQLEIPQQTTRNARTDSARLSRFPPRFRSGGSGSWIRSECPRASQTLPWRHDITRPSSRRLCRGVVHDGTRLALASVQSISKPA